MRDRSHGNAFKSTFVFKEKMRYVGWMEARLDHLIHFT